VKQSTQPIAALDMSGADRRVITPHRHFHQWDRRAASGAASKIAQAASHQCK
jgi:hypothetical protein